MGIEGRAVRRRRDEWSPVRSVRLRARIADDLWLVERVDVGAEQNRAPPAQQELYEAQSDLRMRRLTRDTHTNRESARRAASPCRAHSRRIRMRPRSAACDRSLRSISGGSARNLNTGRESQAAASTAG